MFVLGIGKDVDPQELNKIASGPDNVFRVDSFKDLDDKANQLKRGICVLGIVDNLVPFFFYQYDFVVVTAPWKAKEWW